MMMIVSQDQAATTTSESKMMTTMKMTEKSTLQLNILLDDAVSISEKLAAMKCSASTNSLRSGSHTDIGARRSNEDQHIHIDDVAKHLGDDVYKWANLPSSFYAVFDGHGGAEAASYVKNHAMRLFFENSDLPEATKSDGSVDELFLKELQDFHCKVFLQADKDLKEERSISDYCGTTALTVLALGRHLLISNAGDCRAVISRKGVAKQMSNDHKPSNLLEKKRVEELGGYFEDGYLNGELSVTRALGRQIKSKSPLIAEPEMTEIVLTDDDEFMIIGCDGIWDVMSNEEAVSLVRKQLMQHNDPQRCATELINQALRLHTSDNLTAIVVCFSSHIEPPKPWRPRRGFRESAQ
ncbi:probable protein phosphatase 2C 47 [Tanacetum coccineum]|uniref:protein-serine/threonine phosphatase n=1 Tax=Tanacetum coccineum TaxID=301880 RepID=A0ABQ4X4U0_9ASTR